MRRFLPLLLILLAESGILRAQWPDYGVYHTVGTVKCLSARGGPARLVHKGDWIYAGDKLVLTEAGSGLILYTRDSTYLQLQGKGSYTTADLETMHKKQVAGNITLRYLSLLWEELVQPGADADGSGTPGGVYRGLSLVLTPAPGYKTSLERVHFRWQRVAWATSYRLSLTDSSGGPAYERMTADTQLLLGVRPPLKYGQQYRWTLELLGDSGRRQTGDTGTITLVDEARALAGLRGRGVAAAGGLTAAGGSGVEPAAVVDTALTLAEVYEQQGCLRAAERIYRRLTAVRPDPAIRELYREFKSRNE